MNPTFAEKKYTPPEPHDREERKQILSSIPIKSRQEVKEKAEVKLEAFLFGTRNGKPLPKPPETVELRLRRANEEKLRQYISEKFKGVEAEIIPAKPGEKYPVLRLTYHREQEEAAVPKMRALAPPAEAQKADAEKPKPAKEPRKEPATQGGPFLYAGPAVTVRRAPVLHMPGPESLFNGLTETNYYERLEWLKKNSTFENLALVVSEMQSFKPVTPVEKQFMKQVLDYTLSFKKAMQTQDDFDNQHDKLVRRVLKLGQYIIGKKDCYTFVMAELNRALERPGRYHNTRPPQKVAYQGLVPKGNVSFSGVGDVFLADRTYKKGQPFTFPPGADIFVPAGSPFGTHRDHHGIVVRGGTIIHLGGKELNKDDLDWFLSHATTIKVSIPNDANYAQVYSAVPFTITKTTSGGKKRQEVHYRVELVTRQD